METESYQTLQQVFFESVESGDLCALEASLENTSEIDVNVVDKNGKTALQVAIFSGNIETIGVLLKHDAVIGDALFNAIELKFTKAIEMILAHPKGMEVIDAHAGNHSEEFHPDTTPLILAAHQNDYDIIKLLIKQGATPLAKSTVSYQTEQHTIQHSIGTLNVYKALASEAYMSAIEFETSDSPDPFRRAFELCRELRRESSKEYEFREEYLELAAKCEQFSADLLSQVRNSTELKTILNHAPNMNGKHKEERPMKVLYAVNRNQKKFVAHPHCQQHLIELWYHGLVDWRDSSRLRNVFISILIMLAFPVLGLLYLILPFGKFGRFMRIPYIKFLMHTSSFICFILLLFMSTQHFRYSNVDDDSGQDDDRLTQLNVKRTLSQQRGPPPTPVEWFIFVWVVGMTCREIREMRNSGFFEYITNAWNVMDLIQLGLYWVWICLRLAAIILIHKERMAFHHEHSEETIAPSALCNDTRSIVMADDNNLDTLKNLVNLKTESTLLSLDPAYNSTDGCLRSLLNEIENGLMLAVRELVEDVQSSPRTTHDEALANLTRKLTEIHRLLSSLSTTNTRALKPRLKVHGYHLDFKDISFSKPRSDWSQDDPTLIAECIIALANVVTVVRFLRTMVINEYVGPLQISVGKMMKDITKFMFIFMLVWVAFALALTQVYWSYAADGVFHCMIVSGSYKECYGKRYFPDVLTSMKTLFWSLYGLIDLEAIDVEANHRTIEFFGGLLFAGYQIAAVIILLNLLIALMGTTYDSIVQNADMEWKFSRSDMWMDFFREGASEPPPFNVLPGTRSIIKFCRRLFRCVLCSKERALDKISRSYEKQKQYRTVCRHLVWRYFADKQASYSDIDGSHTTKNNSTIRFEIDEKTVRLERTVGELKRELSVQLRQLKSAIDDNNRAGIRAIDDIRRQVEAMQQ